MEQVKGSLYSQNHTKVFHENHDKMYFGAPHHFVVVEKGSNTDQIIQRIGVENIDIERRLTDDELVTLTMVEFQEGPVGEVGINGVFNEDLIAMVLERLKAFQEGKYACRENAMAITNLEQALMWLRKRTEDRAARGVLGTTNT